MRTLFTIAIAFVLFKPCCAQQLESEYHQIVSTFINCIKNDNTAQLRNSVAYPLGREYPISDVKNEIEFQRRYNEIFDDNLKEQIIQSDIETDWSAVGWRGIMLNSGTLWLDYEGRLIAVNYQSAHEQEEKARLIAIDKNSIHKSIQDFKEPVLILETAKFRVRIDELNNGKYRYASWSINTNMNEQPDLILKNGEWIPDGSGGNHSFVFTNGVYKYECAIYILGTTHTPPAALIVYKNNNEILNQSAENITR